MIAIGKMYLYSYLSLKKFFPFAKNLNIRKKKYSKHTMSEELDFEMPMALCSNYQASMEEIEELKEEIAKLGRKIAEFKNLNAELTKKMI